jgi:hypothetical protein
MGPVTLQGSCLRFEIVMHRWARILLAAITGLTGTACTQEQIGQVWSVIQPAQIQGQGGVSGKVVDQTTQKPIPEAQVTVGNQRTTADVAGLYAMQGLTTETLFVRVEANGYQPFFGEVQVATGTTQFDIPLKPLVASPAAASDQVASPSPSPQASAVGSST